jgi:hypothetical protein
VYANPGEHLDAVGVMDPGSVRRVHLGLIDAVLAGDSSGRVADIAATELGEAVAIVLPALDLAVVSPPSREWQLDSLCRYVADRLLGAPANVPGELLCEVPVATAGERLGSAMLLGRTRHHQADEILRLAAFAAVTAATLEQGADESQTRAGSALLEDILRSPAPHPGEIVARAKRLGCDLADGATALDVQLGPSDADWTLSMIVQACPGALAARRGDHLHALLPAAAGDTQRLARRLRRRVPTGLSPLQRDIAELGPAMRFAELALALGQRQSLGPDELLLGSWRLLLQVAARDPHEMDELIDTTIGAALAADGDTSGDLLATLRTYLDQGGRLSATADAVHAHRHTVGYRLARITELTGHDARTPDGQRQLTLGLQALTLRNVATDLMQPRSRGGASASDS